MTCPLCTAGTQQWGWNVDAWIYVELEDISDGVGFKIEFPVSVIGICAGIFMWHVHWTSLFGVASICPLRTTYLNILWAKERCLCNTMQRCPRHVRPILGNTLMVQEMHCKWEGNSGLNGPYILVPVYVFSYPVLSRVTKLSSLRHGLNNRCCTSIQNRGWCINRSMFFWGFFLSSITINMESV